MRYSCRRIKPIVMNAEITYEFQLRLLAERMERLEQLISELANSTHQEQTFVDIPGACSLLGISRATLYNIMAAGQLPYTQVGRNRRFFVADIRKYLMGNYHEIKPSILKP